MIAPARTILIGKTLQQTRATEVEGAYVTMLGETYYQIRRYDAMEPFFMSIISGSDHWMFISSTGGLSAGRVNAEQAIFPYYTSDKLSENSDHSGSKTILLVTQASRTSLWEPFSNSYQGVYRLERNLYKNIPGSALVFEEINRDLGLTFRYAWRTSDKYGFVRTSWIINDSNQACEVEALDGLQNLLPANVTIGVQHIFSVLLDAYKRSELEPRTGLGIFSLSSRLSDLAEPSESLKATTVWQLGLPDAKYLLSSAQLDKFRTGQGITQETDVRGRRGAYLVNAILDINGGTQTSWHIVADAVQDSVTIARLLKELGDDPARLADHLEQDIVASGRDLQTIVGSADGLQVSADHLGTAHHFANVMFNVMRGGIFADQNRISSADLRDFVAVRNLVVLNEFNAFFNGLPATLSVDELRQRADASGSLDVVRLCYSYLPLTFSRRHGDPSRPWNRFSINVRKVDGSRQLDYEGNWRDIFQNWEALAYSYPEFVEGMISNFLNATTPDGYNPYRITRSGIDWESPNPDDPWANIGYWSDHQIIYLQKLLEVANKAHPGALEAMLNRTLFSYGNVPYRIKPYTELLKDYYDTIEFDWPREKSVERIVKTTGTDGKLVRDSDGNVYHATLAEKLLTLLLAKLVNFVPEGGLWMSTQRPEWNDANNALVGKGLSVVTIGYLRRYIAFFTQIVESSGLTEIPVTQDVAGLFKAIENVLAHYRRLLSGKFNDEQRRLFMDAVGQAGSSYRWHYYENGFSGALETIPTENLLAFLALAKQYVDHTLRANKRSDNLYHAYNIIHIGKNTANVTYLAEMLEGQVAILSSGLLTADESLILLRAIRNSSLYRADQHSYLLYPNRHLPGFLEKNCIEDVAVRHLSLVNALTKQQDRSLIVRDMDGVYHFAGHLRNAKDVQKVLSSLGQDSQYAKFVAAESDAILALFEEVFHHKAFTGRSGTFFAYEGLGSIYWHMVSKLLLAAQETALRAVDEGASTNTVHALIAAYYDIRKGISFNKTPGMYGAFPTDPYSHTPEGAGAKQPGMTGLVKEEILTRLAELGLFVKAGRLNFDPVLLRRGELLGEPSVFEYVDVAGTTQQIDLPAASLAFTFCQVPFVVHIASVPSITLYAADGTTKTVAGGQLDANLSRHLFERNGVIRQVAVTFAADKLLAEELLTTSGT